ncbi:MAG: hypothetical protein ABWZ40_04960 [Caulobacterales bacterium]
MTTPPPLKSLPELPLGAQALRRRPANTAKPKVKSQARVRVMPAVITAIICLLAAKGLDITRHYAEAATEKAAAPKPKEAADAAKDKNAEVNSAAAADMDAGVAAPSPEGTAPIAPDLKLASAVPQPGSLDPGTPGTAPVCPGPSIAEQAGLSASEAQVLQSLSDRRRTLEGRDEELSTREQLLNSAAARIEQRLTEMKALQARVQAALGGLDEKADADTAALVRVYEKMKPKAAAAVMETLDDDVSLRVARRMKEASLAVILGNMQPARAKHLTELLAKRVDAAKVAAEKAVAGDPKAKADAAKPAKAAPKKTAAATPAPSAPAAAPPAAAAAPPGA